MDAQVAAGPVGKDFGAGMGVTAKGLTPVIAYSHSKGNTHKYNILGFCFSFLFGKETTKHKQKKRTHTDTLT